MLNFDYFLFSKKNDFFQEICRILAYNLISFAILKRYEKYKSDALLELSKYSPKNLILIKKTFYQISILHKSSTELYGK